MSVLLAAAGLALGSLAAASPAAAHLDLVSTSPSAGAVLRNPSADILLTFSQAATPSGTGFTLLDGRGAPIAVTATGTDGDKTWRIRATQPLTAGRYGLRWQVAAGDAHPKTGTVQFRVVAARTAAGSPEPTPVNSAASDTAQHPQGHAPDGGAPVAGANPHADMPGHDDASASGGAGLEAALIAGAATATPLWELLATAGRWMSFAGLLVAVGGLVVVVTTLVGSPGDVRLSQRVIRVAAALAAVGAVIEGMCLLGTLGTAVPWQPAAAVALRLAAGAALALDLTLQPRSGGGRRSRDVPALPVAPPMPTADPAPGGRAATRAAARGATALSTSTLSRRPGPAAAQLVLTPPVRTGRVRGVPARPATAAALSLLLLSSFMLDGHTTMLGPWPVVALAAMTHTAAAAVWVGGVILLATLLLVRARAGVPTGAGELAVRFSVPATAAVAAGLAGTALTVLIIDTPADLTSTPWGRVLLVKLVLVAVVALMGYANNRYALPALDAWRPGTARLLRRTVAAEAAVMVAVLLVTAALVASPT